MTSGKDQCARTPARLYREIRSLAFADQDGFSVFDPCPPNPTFDGLAIEWGPRAYVNPPFAEAGAWVQKASRESSERGTQVAMLLPMRCSSAWFADLEARATLCIWTRRAPFAGYKLSLPLPNMTALIPPRPPALLTKQDDLELELFPVLGGLVTVQPGTLQAAADHLRALHPDERVDICTTSASKQLATIPVDHHPSVTLAPASALHTTAFRALVPYVTHLYFIAPRLRHSAQDTNPLFAPSIAFRVSPFRTPLAQHIEPRIYLVRPTKAYTVADNAPAEIS